MTINKCVNKSNQFNQPLQNGSKNKSTLLQLQPLFLSLASKKQISTQSNDPTQQKWRTEKGKWRRLRKFQRKFFFLNSHVGLFNTSGISKHIHAYHIHLSKCAGIESSIKPSHGWYNIQVLIKCILYKIFFSHHK